MLGASPAASPTAMGVFNHSFEALFPPSPTGALGCEVCFAPPLFLPVYLCTNVGPQGATCHTVCPVLRHSESGPLGLSVRKCGATGSASGQTACPVRPTLRQSRSPVSVLPRQRESSPPWLPVSTPPTGLDECLFFISLVSDFLLFYFLSVLVVRGDAVCLPTPPSWFMTSVFTSSFTWVPHPHPQTGRLRPSSSLQKAGG